MPRTHFPAAGLWCPGGPHEDVKPAFLKDGRGALVSSSRQIIFAYEQLDDLRPVPEEIYQAIADAARKTRDDVNCAIASI